MQRSPLDPPLRPRLSSPTVDGARKLPSHKSRRHIPSIRELWPSGGGAVLPCVGVVYVVTIINHATVHAILATALLFHAKCVK